jgi:predicted DNA-binding protein (MmcQ/YjbR family)
MGKTRRVSKPRRASRAAQGLPDFCRSLPQATEDIKWGKDLVFSIGGKMFAVFNTEDQANFSFKTTPENFSALSAMDGLCPAPYAARYHWVSVIKPRSLPTRAAQQLIRESYEIVASCLPKKVRKQLGLGE